MSNKDLSHKAVANRQSMSAPFKFLTENNLLIGRVLDFGCGKGLDAEALNIERYDPYYYRKRVEGKFDTIVCNYVLNVVDTENQNKIIEAIDSLLNKGGIAYLTVRADIIQDRFTSWGTYQRDVRLPLPVIKATSWYRMYEYRKGN